MTMMKGGYHRCPNS